MSISLIQTTSNFITSAATTIAAPAINVATGSMIIVAVQGTGSTPTSVTDSTGANTYTALTSHTNLGGQGFIRFFFCSNVTGNASFVVTGHFSSTTATIFVWNVAGMGAATSDVDVAGTATSATSVATGSYTTAQANEFLAALSFHAGTASTFAAETGYSLDSAAIQGSTGNNGAESMI